MIEISVPIYLALVGYSFLCCKYHLYYPFKYKIETKESNNNPTVINKEITLLIYFLVDLYKFFFYLNYLFY